MSDRRVVLQPLDFHDQSVLNHICSGIEEAFGIPADVLEPIPVEHDTYNEERDQYHSTAILKRLSDHVPRDAVRLLAVTDIDLYVPQLTFVFGEAAVDGRVSIISLMRLRQGFYGEPQDDRLFIERAVKEAIHELGHTFGLRHCPNPRCIMHFSNGIRDTDYKSADFCAECASQLYPKLRSYAHAA